ncbi:hypothetical protein Emed_004517 [Eimeria media]
MAAHLIQWPTKANRLLTSSIALRTPSCTCGRISCKRSISFSRSLSRAARTEAAEATGAAAAADAAGKTYHYTKSSQRTRLRGSRGFGSMRVFQPLLLSLPHPHPPPRLNYQAKHHFASQGLKPMPWESSTTSSAASETEEKRNTETNGMEGELQRLWCLPPKPPHIPVTVWKGILRGLHQSADNPIGITARLIEAFFKHEAMRPPFDPLHPKLQQTVQQQEHKDSSRKRDHLQQNGLLSFVYLDSLNPLVSVGENFDSLLIEAGHCSRSTSDSYYLDSTFSLSHAELAAMRERNKAVAGEEGCSSSNEGSNRMLLRTHGTAHQAALLSWGVRRAVWSGAVARRDQVDPTHYPVFHQMDGIRVFESEADLDPNTLDLLQAQHAALLQAVQLATEMQKQQQQQLRQPQQMDGSRLHAFNEACAAAGLQEVSASTLLSFACFDGANPHRANPIVLQLQLTLERLVRYLWAHKPTCGVQTPQGLHAQQLSSPDKKESHLNESSDARSSCSQQMGSSSNQPVLRWVYDAHFPFTSPSIELEVLHEDKWIELLGAGEIQRQIIASAACSKQQEWKERDLELMKQLPFSRPLKPLTKEARGWAFGLGLERIAMLLFSIDDIRLLWSEDSRFTQQFKDGKVKTFVPFSHMPPVYKDVSFWLPAETQFVTNCEELSPGNNLNEEKVLRRDQAVFDVARLYEICREEGGSLIESVSLRDAFTHPITQRQSLCFRLTYKALDRTLTHQEVNAIQDKVVNRLKEVFAIEFR